MSDNNCIEHQFKPDTLVTKLMNEKYNINSVFSRLVGVEDSVNYKFYYINSYLNDIPNKPKESFSNFFLFKNVISLESDVEIYFPNASYYPAKPLYIKELTYNKCLTDCISSSISERPVKIFFTGDNIFGLKYFREYQKLPLNETVDLWISFEYYNFKNYIRFPIWIAYFFDLNSTYYEIDQWIKNIESNKITSLDNVDRKFACLVASHDEGNNRFVIGKIVEKFGTVEYAGKFNNNTNELTEKFNNNKHEYIKNFKFNICSENYSNLGYTTEKIFQALVAGCIPIYYGSCNYPEPEILNNNRILLVNPADPIGLDKQLNLLLNDKYYAENFLKQNVFTRDAAFIIYNMIVNLRKRLEYLGIKYI